MLYQIFKNRPYEATTHIFVLIAISLQFAPQYKVLHSFSHFLWLFCTAFGYLHEGIRFSQLFSCLFYALMTLHYLLNSSSGTQQF